jgi:hypothetical protein
MSGLTSRPRRGSSRSAFVPRRLPDLISRATKRLSELGRTLYRLPSAQTRRAKNHDIITAFAALGSRDEPVRMPFRGSAGARVALWPVRAWIPLRRSASPFAKSVNDTSDLRPPP